MSDDEIKINIKKQVTDINGNPIEVKVQSPEYITETFTWDGIVRTTQNEEE